MPIISENRIGIDKDTREEKSFRVFFVTDGNFIPHLML